MPLCQRWKSLAFWLMGKSMQSLGNNYGVPSICGERFCVFPVFLDFTSFPVPFPWTLLCLVSFSLKLHI